MHMSLHVTSRLFLLRSLLRVKCNQPPASARGYGTCVTHSHQPTQYHLKVVLAQYLKACFFNFLIRPTKLGKLFQL